MITALAITNENKVFTIEDWSKIPSVDKLKVKELINVASTKAEFNGFKLESDAENITWSNYLHTLKTAVKEDSVEHARACSLEPRLIRMTGASNETPN